MLYLLLAIICSASIALLFKHSETTGMNRYAITTTNYATAALVSLALLLFGRSESITTPRLSGALHEIGQALSNGTVLAPDISPVWAALIGLGAGAIFFLAFVYYQISVREHGVGLAGTFTKLGILVPMSLSLILWKELPTTIQTAGIALAVFSIVLVNWPVERDWRCALRPALLLLFLFGGIAEFTNKVFQKYGLQSDKAIFLLCTFGVAFLFSLAVTLYRPRPVARCDLVMGVLVGVPNLFSSFFLIKALATIPATVVFPAYGAGTIVIINLVGAIFFRERLARREQAAIALTVVALILINLR